MRTLDLILGSLGLAALGLVLSSLPAVSAAESSAAGQEPDRASETAPEGGSTAVETRDLTGGDLVSDCPHEHLGALCAALGSNGPGHSMGGTLEGTEGAALGIRRLVECGELRLSPAERAARLRALRHLLTPRGDSPQAVADRRRLDLWLQHVADLRPGDEREIS